MSESRTTDNDVQTAAAPVPDDSRVRLLKRLAAGTPEVLRPKMDVRSAWGYTYPEAAEVFDGRAGEEVGHLERLADAGHLDRALADKIRLCPTCFNGFLNFREVCPKCAGVDVDVVQMLHHFRCGYVGLEGDFRKGVNYECPKCTRPLRHIGVDYERPAANFHCAPCKHVFPEPPVNCLCFKCGAVFDADKALVRAIHAYRLTPKGSLAAARGVVEEGGTSRAFVHSDLGVYTFSYFKQLLAQEIPRARRFKRPLTILFLRPDRMDAYEAQAGRPAAGELFKTLVTVIRETLRTTDVPSLYGDWTLAVILMDTPLETSYIAAERLQKIVAGMTPSGGAGFRVTFSVGLAGLTEELATAPGMIQAAGAAIEAASAAGGHCVRPALASLVSSPPAPVHSP